VDSVLFSLDRETFNHIVKDAASKKRQKYEEFLAKVDLLTGNEKKFFKLRFILKDVDPYERL